MNVENEISPRERKWDERFMNIARAVASWSKDRSRKVGCVIVDQRRRIRATGYNGFPEGVNDNVVERHERPAKYWWTEHAERNAIYDAARAGVALAGCTIYLPWYPCIDCARAIVQVGIAEVVAVKPDWNDPKYGAEFRTAAELFIEAYVFVRYIPGEAPVQQQLS